MDSSLKKEIMRGWLRLVVKLSVAGLLLFICFGVLAGIMRVSGMAMDGRIKDGDFVIFDRTEKSYQAGDIIIYQRGGDRRVSEIVATEGDMVTLDSDGYLLVNGLRVRDEPVTTATAGESLKIASSYRVPTGQFYVLNENLSDSVDSRTFGGVQAGDVRGKVIGILLRTVNL